MTPICAIRSKLPDAPGTAALAPEPRRARRNIARALARKEWRKRIATLAVSCGVAVLASALGSALAPAAYAQGSRKDDIVFNAQGRPMGGATVRVCTAAATGQPCSPLANIFSDPAMTQALSNPIATDGLGNYTFYAAAGRYEIEISGTGITTKQLPNVILPNDPSTPTFTSLTTTSGISAFSLSLSGNLTVNGSTAVTGAFSVAGNSTVGGSQTVSGAGYFAGGVPSYDVVCTGVTATDSAALNTALHNAVTQNNAAGGIVILQGQSHNCAIDGALVTIPSQVQIGINGNVVMQNGHGFEVGQTDIVSKVHFFGIRSSGAATTFGNQTVAEITWPGGIFATPLIDVAGIEGDFLIEGLSISSSTNVPVVRIHTFDKVTTNCPSPPCGSTQVSIRHTAITNVAGTGIPLSLDDSGLVIRGAWSGATTYAYDDEVTYMGTRYVAAQGSNLNHAPTGGLPWWIATSISGFDASFEGLTLGSTSTSIPSFYNQDFGNVHWHGPQESWLINGGIVQTCTAGFQCSVEFYDLIASETLGTDFITSTGNFPDTEMTHLLPSDSSTYLFKDTTGGACVYFKDNYFFKATLDPASHATCVNPASDYDPSMLGSIANPRTTTLPNLIGYGQDSSGRRNGEAGVVRFQNLSSLYFSPSGSYTGFSIANVADPLGGTFAGRVTTSIASDGPVFANHVSYTPSVGDVMVGLIAVRTAGSTAFNLSLGFGWDGAGSTISENGYIFPTPFSAGSPPSNEWKYYIALKEVTATDGMVHDFTFQIADVSDTTSTYDFAFPYWTYIPASAGLSDSEILNWALSLVPSPPSCAPGQLCSVPGNALSGVLSTKSSAYTLTVGDSWVNVTGTTTITVPHAIVGQRWVVFNSGSGTVTIAADSGNVNGAASITLAANTGKEISCDGTNCFAH